MTVTAAASKAGTSLPINISGGAAASGGSDCLVTVANIVEMDGVSTSGAEKRP